MELVTLEAEDVTDDLNPESRRDIQFFEESQYAYQKEFLSQMLADALEAGRALGGEYFSGPTSRGMGQEEQIAKGADLWLQAQDFLGYDDLITLLQNSNAQAGIDWAWSLQREPTYQKDIASVASYLNPFNTAFEQFGGAGWKLINPFDDKTFPVGEAWDQLTSADDRLLGYGQNPYGSRFKRTTGITDWGDALWFAFDLFDIATLGTGGAVVQPLRRKLAEIMIRTDRWDNALGKKILGDDVYNDLLNRAPSMTEDEYIQFEEDLIRAADEFIGEPSRDIVPQEWIEDDYEGFLYSHDGVILPNIDIGNGIKASFPIARRMPEIEGIRRLDMPVTVAEHAEALQRSFVLIKMPDGTMQPWYRSSSQNSGRAEWFPFEGFGRPNQGDWIRKPETHGQRPPGEQEISDALASRFDHLKPIDVSTFGEPLDPSWVNYNEDFGTLNVAEWGVAREQGFSLRANEGRQQVRDFMDDPPFDIDEAVEAHYDWHEPGNSAARLEQANRGAPDPSDFSSYQEYEVARQDWEAVGDWEDIEVSPTHHDVSRRIRGESWYDAHRSPAPEEPDFPTGIERLEGETFWGGMTRHMFNVDAEQSVMKESISEAPLVKRPSNVTPTADEARAFIETYAPQVSAKVMPFAVDDDAIKFATILYDYLYDVDFNLGRVKGKGFGSNLHSYPPFLTPNSQATDLYIRSQDTYGATLFDEQGVEGASAIKDAIKVTRNGEPLEYSDVLELASDMDDETAEFWRVIDDIFFSGETSANALTSPEGFNQWWDAVQEAKMKLELEYPDLGVTIPEEILDTYHERAMDAIAFEAQLGEHVFGDIFVKNGKFYRATPREIEDRLYRSDAALTRGPLDEGYGDILDSVFPPEQSLGEEATEKVVADEFGSWEADMYGGENLDDDFYGGWDELDLGPEHPTPPHIRQNAQRHAISGDDFHILGSWGWNTSWNRESQIAMDYDGFLEVIYRLREGTEQHAERLSWLEPHRYRGYWADGVEFEHMEEEAYGAVRDFVESSFRAFIKGREENFLGDTLRDGVPMRLGVGEITPENELFVLDLLYDSVKHQEDSLFNQLQEFMINAGRDTDPTRIPVWERNLLFIKVPLINLGIPLKTRETVEKMLKRLSQSQRDAIARDGILGAVPTDENMSALKDIFIGIRSMVDDVGEASNIVEAFREGWGF